MEISWCRWPRDLPCRDNGDPASLITAGIELLEALYAHTVSPLAIAAVTAALMFAYSARFPVAVALAGHRAPTCSFADRFYSVGHGRLS